MLQKRRSKKAKRDYGVDVAQSQLSELTPRKCYLELARAARTERTLRLHLKTLRSTHKQHSVELTDNVVLDRHGRRVPTPDYAKVSIDKLPRFQKKQEASLHSRHEVELTDDVILLDSNGKRIPRVITPISRS